MISDNQNEIFDLVDEDDNVIGKVRRGEANRNKNLIHRSIGVAVFNSHGELFLQQRSATKDTDPLKWTIACSGHVVSDSSTGKGTFLVSPHRESPCMPATPGVSLGYQSATSPSVSLSLYEETAHRELKEELGIRDLPLTFVAKYICRAPNETEIVMLFKTSYEGPFILHKEEILQGKFFTRKELVRLVQLGKLEISFMGKVALQKLGWIVR